MERLQALLWVSHLVGDIHQPLHVGDNGDRGGNEILVSFDGREGRGYNLHAIWDRDLPWDVLERSGGVAAFIRETRREADTVPTRGSSAAWAYESWSAARTLAYPSLPRPPACQAAEPPFEELGVPYERAVKPAVHRQLVRAGARLAAVLNEAFVG